MNLDKITEGERTAQVGCSRCVNDEVIVQSVTGTSVEIECDTCGHTCVVFAT